MTPEAVIYRYLEVASRQPFAVDDLVRVLGADADLLGSWLNVLDCAADPAIASRALGRLAPQQLRILAQAQAWAVLPGAGSARLGLDRWRAVLRSSFLAEVLAEHLGLTNPRALRWRVLLAVSGVNIARDERLKEFSDFRGIKPELLRDADPALRIFAVVDALEVLDEVQATGLAQRLLDVDGAQFTEFLEQAGNRCAELTRSLDLDADTEADWTYRLWVQQQVGLLTNLLAVGDRLEDVTAGHALASRSLVRRVPVLLVLNDRGELVTLEDNGIRIPLDSTVSSIARAVRERVQLNVEDGVATPVTDRQLLRLLGTREAVCLPLAADQTPVGALMFIADDDVDHEFALTPYASRLGHRLAALRRKPTPDIEFVKRYRQQEEKRLREIVHEVNNPLSVVHNYLHILALRLQHEPSAIEQLDMIGSELKRAGEIMLQVRDTSPIAELAASTEIVFAEFDSNGLARRTCELHRGFAEDHQVELLLELTGEVLLLLSDEHRLAQILSNLMRNAIEACPGETVCLGSNRGVFREGREGIELYVRDTGAGLPREVLDRLAEPKDTAKGGEHAGLGLHIVHRLVHELEGSIDVRTAPGRGTTFTVYLPLNPL